MAKFDKALALAQLVDKRRAQLGISKSQLARRAGVDPALITKISQCRIGQPTLTTLQGLARGLNMPLAKLYAETAWLPEGTLPGLRPYMRAKYDQLPDEALEEIERFIDWMAQKYGTGPLEGEDE